MATTFTVGSGDYVRPWKNVRVQHFPEAASQTFKRGAVVISGGAGVENQVRVAGDVPTSAILGIAAADASGTTGTMIPVWLGHNDAEFIGRSVSSEAADFSDIGTLRAMLIDATNSIWVVDTTDAGHDSVIPLQYLNPLTKNVQTTEGDTSVLIVFKFRAAATIWASETA